MVLEKAAAFDEFTSFDSAWDYFQDCLSPLGFRSFIYITIGGDWTAPFLATNMPALYDGVDVASDPFLGYCCESYQITLTGPAYLPDYEYLPPEAQLFIRGARKQGFESGFGLPMRLQGSDRFGGFNIGTPLLRPDFEERFMARREELRAFCLLTHRNLERLSHPAGHPDRTLTATPPQIAPLDALTAREKDVAYFIAQGLSRKDCARAVNLSPHTVSEYVKSIYRKLGVNNRVMLTRLFVDAGIDLPDVAIPPK